jgi:uncharacterized protein YndB with AHSA1/START domain
MTRIRKEIVIQAPVSKVWRHLTDPARIAAWLMPNNFVARAGRAFRLDCGTEGEISCVLQEIVPEERLVYSWTSPRLRIETTVTITLTPMKGRTRVTLVHSGWDALPPRERGIAGPFRKGWGLHLRTLKDQIDRGARD